MARQTPTMKYYRISSATVRNAILGLEHRVWGLSPTWQKYLKRIKNGDRVVLYTVENHMFFVICEVTKEAFCDHERRWPDDVYPWRIGIDPLPVSQKPVTLKDARRASGDPGLGGVFIRPIVELAPEAYDIILSLMTSEGPTAKT